MILEILDSELLSDSEPLDSIDPYLLLVTLSSGQSCHTAMIKRCSFVLAALVMSAHVANPSTRLSVSVLSIDTSNDQ